MSTYNPLSYKNVTAIENNAPPKFSSASGTDTNQDNAASGIEQIVARSSSEVLYSKRPNEYDFFDADFSGALETLYSNKTDLNSAKNLLAELKRRKELAYSKTALTPAARALELVYESKYIYDLNREELDIWTTKIAEKLENGNHKKVIKRIIQCAVSADINDKRQIAYILSTAFNESEFVPQMEKWNNIIWRTYFFDLNAAAYYFSCIPDGNHERHIKQSYSGQNNGSESLYTQIEQHLTEQQKSDQDLCVMLKSRHLLLEKSKALMTIIKPILLAEDRWKGMDFYRYAGKGLAQVTWKDNYKSMADLITSELKENMTLSNIYAGLASSIATDGLNLLEHPERMLEQEISELALVLGMRDGKYTGKKRKLDRYFVNEHADWLGARAIINGNDEAFKFMKKAIAYHIILAPFSIGLSA